VIWRQSVAQPVQTGLKSIDSMVPIGRGQRELIIGDRQTGKTAVAIDTIINQKGKDLICVYVAIGQKASSIKTVIRKLEEHGAMDYTIVVAATASSRRRCSTCPVLWLHDGRVLPRRGQDALIIYDDLTKQAWRTARSRCCCAARRAAKPTRRRVLPALAAARARRAGQPGVRREVHQGRSREDRLADRAADHRDGRPAT